MAFASELELQLEDIGCEPKPTGYPCRFPGLQRYDVLEVFRADSCNLHGHIQERDLQLWTPTSGGAMLNLNKFKHLVMLSLANNRISNFGYDVVADDTCWAVPPSVLLPVLKTLTLRNCSTLLKISRAVISAVDELDLRGAAALQLPVSPSASSCKNFTLSEKLAACAADTQPTCLYFVPAFSRSEFFQN